MEARPRSGEITYTALVQVAQGPAAALQEFIGNWQTARPLRLQSANKPEHPQSTGNHRRDGGLRCRRDASRTGEPEGTQPDDMQRLPNKRPRASARCWEGGGRRRRGRHPHGYRTTPTTESRITNLGKHTLEESVAGRLAGSLGTAILKSANRSPRTLPAIDQIALWKDRESVFPWRYLIGRGQRTEWPMKCDSR